MEGLNLTKDILGIKSKETPPLGGQYNLSDNRKFNPSPVLMNNLFYTDRE